MQALFAERAIPTTTFPKFRKLPPELRRMIWTLIIPNRRVVKISSTRHLNYSRGMALKANANLPIPLSVSSESRQIALKYFTLAFELVLSSPVYFNFQHDTLLFDDKPTCELFQERNVNLRDYGCDEIQKLRHLMIKLQNGDELGVFDDLGYLEMLVIGFDYSFRSKDVFEQVLGDIETYCRTQWEDSGVRDVGIELMEWRQLKTMVERMKHDDGNGFWTQLILRDFSKAVAWAARLFTTIHSWRS
ncbi:hypothetical protein DL98DRAFT_622755 [Cadophora sp. DSE1049]|nr:hypothetical protein DL98DRAFT_622755 [Cadophora sp. DSE1049]